MDKINNTTIKDKALMSLGILAIFALGVFIIPLETEAQYNYVYDHTTGLNNTTPARPNNNYIPSNIYNYQTTPVQNYYPVVTNTTSQVYTVPTVDSTRKVAQTTTSSTTAKKTTTTTKKVETDDKYKDLAASTILGKDGFLPSGLLQWILFAILLLLIVILTRRVFGSNKKYQQTPLKHS